jgi:2-C-methyl-D-erythritol 4-phosphate cytidylyltransferase
MIVSAIVLAAGRGSRMQAGKNKVLLPIRGEPMIGYCLRTLAGIPEVSELILVCRAADMTALRATAAAIAREVLFVEGGMMRRDSALAGARAASGDMVLIHDGARPFASASLIRQIVNAAQRAGAAVPVDPIPDLLYRTHPAGWIDAISDLGEQSLVRAQTPQGFRRELILRSLELAPTTIRDDATAVLLTGHPVATVPGEPCNIKVTRPGDVALAEAIAASRESACRG